MLITPLLTILFASAVGGVNHAPHDSTYAIASAQLSNGEVATAVVHSEQEILVTRDGGYSWNIIGGDGLQLANATSISYHAGLNTPGGQGAFVVGTDSGAWLIEPQSNFASKFSSGFLNGDKYLLSIDSPSHGTNAPSIAVSSLGNVYALNPNTLKWTIIYQEQNVMRIATKVAIAPHASVLNSLAGDQDIFLIANGKLHVSHDLGTTWSLSPQFSTAAQSLFDWSITSIDVSDNYQNDQTLLIGLGRLNASGTADEGQIWKSSDSAATFTLSHSLDTSVSAILSTPADPSGNSYWLAAGRQYPNYGSYFGTGILRSDDNGSSFTDNNSVQDFLLEDSPGKKSGATDMFHFSQLQVAADFSQTGTVMYGRQEGLFVSHDSGVHWRQLATRFANRFRDVETAVAANGDDIVFGAGYGTGTVMYNANSDSTQVLPFRSPMVYQRRISASPNYDIDGRLLVAGNVYLYEWQSDDVAASNPWSSTWWYKPQVRNPITLRSDAGYPRGVKYSPHFDPTATMANADLTYFWFSAEGQVRRTSDNGLTSEQLFTDTNGANTGEVQTIAIAETYDATTSRTDVYAGTTEGLLYRLISDKWFELHNFNNKVAKLITVPNFSRPNNPTLFAMMDKAPFIYKITDSLTGVNVENMRHNLPKVFPTGITLHPDFANTPIVYLSSKTRGAFSLDLSVTPLAWQQFGNMAPLAAVDDIELSKNFATDNAAYLATINGMMQLDSNNDWQDILGVFRLDDTDESISTYSPNNPSVIDPTHMWPWRSSFRWTLPNGLDASGDEVLFADYDGDYLTVPVRGASVSLMTYRGPRIGAVTLRLIDSTTGSVVATQYHDLLDLPANGSEEVISMTLPDPTKIYSLEVTAELDTNEMIVFDGIEISLK
ncbi:MAG: hypothetical protein H8E25_05350 [Planctomycetes bacterium]|nr:hypothetical protein [Planctomycetota bacterium]